MVDDPAQTETEATLTPPLSPPQTAQGVQPVPLVDDSFADSDAAAAGQQQQLLSRLEKRDKEKVRALSDAERDKLSKMTFMASGGVAGAKNNSYDLYEKGERFGRVDERGMDPLHREPPDLAENQQYNIESSVKTLTVYKATYGNNVTISFKTDLENMMDTKIATMMGMKVRNPPARTIDEVNPALARQIEETVRRMKAEQPAPAETFGNRTTDGLITTPGAIDQQQGVLGQTFAANAAGAPVTTLAAAPPDPSAQPRRPGQNLG